LGEIQNWTVAKRAAEETNATAQNWFYRKVINRNKPPKRVAWRSLLRPENSDEKKEAEAKPRSEAH